MREEASLDGVVLPFEFRVAGTGHDGRYSIIRRRGKKSAEVRLIPEPENPFDRSAIGVHLLWHTDLGREVWDQIGYVPADFSAVVNALIGGGEWAIQSAFIRRLDISPDLDAPRVDVRLEGHDLRGA